MYICYFIVGYVSNEKFHCIAVEILLYPSICFTITQLHTNSFLHNASPMNVRSVLEHLFKCELIHHIEKGLKISRRSTSVYIKRLPICQHTGEIDDEQIQAFDDKLKEFKSHHPELTVNEYLKKNMIITLDAVGVVADDLVKFFSLPEYMKIDITPLYNLKETGALFH